MTSNDCGDTCAARIKAQFVQKAGIDVTVTTVKPAFISKNEPGTLKCEHGTTWFAEPSPDQIEHWGKKK